tara:strand:- start:180 stop:506 length:327 start_codon:yes stop_codon:yes gene_type:complete
MIIDITNKYFHYFKNKDIENLSILFHENIKLRDWEIEVSGYKSVVNQNIQIFKNLGNFDLKIIKLNQSNNIIFAEIEIVLENKEIVKVLDKIEFDTNLKIISITAFKG